MDFKFIHLDKIHEIKIEKSGDQYKAIIADKTYKVVDFVVQSNVVSFSIKNKFHIIYFAVEKDKTHVAVDAEHYLFELDRGMASRVHGPAVQKGDSVSSPMPGLVVNIPIAVGDEVEEGATLAIIEAMKMQNELRAPRAGIVKKINYKEGEQIEALQPIVELET